MRRGEVRWYTFRVPDKRRPVLILTRDSAIGFFTGITVTPITTTVREIPSEVLLTPEDDGIPAISAVNLDNIQTIQKSGLGSLLTTLSPWRMQQVERAVCFALGIDRLLVAD